MNFESNVAERKELLEAMMKKAKKCGKIFSVVGILIGLFMMVAMIDGSGFLSGLLVGLFVGAACAVGYYFYGQILYFGFVKVVKWLIERGIGFKEVAGASGTSLLVSYILGGRKAAKMNFVMLVGVVLVVATIGILIGLVDYIKALREVKELGIA